jgi:uncharacterized protein involved in exopolysaccharide biosynthesis
MAGQQPDPRLAQIERLKTETARLHSRLSQKDAELAELRTFRGEALSRLAAQHEEIVALRRDTQNTANGVRLLRP